MKWELINYLQRQPLSLPIFPRDTRPSDQASSCVCPPIGAVGSCVSPEDWLQLSLIDLLYCVTSPQVPVLLKKKKISTSFTLRPASFSVTSSSLSLKHTQAHAPPHTVRSRDNIFVESFLNSADEITYHYLCQSASSWRLLFKSSFRISASQSVIENINNKAQKTKLLTSLSLVLRPIINIIHLPSVDDQ